VEKPDLTVI